jgi:hypothetical protein
MGPDFLNTHWRLNDEYASKDLKILQTLQLNKKVIKATLSFDIAFIYTYFPPQFRFVSLYFGVLLLRLHRSKRSFTETTERDVQN